MKAHSMTATTFALAYCLLALCRHGVDAFGVANHHHRSTTNTATGGTSTSTTALHLVPGQGKQLVAAGSCAYSNCIAEVDEVAAGGLVVEESVTVTAAGLMPTKKNTPTLKADDEAAVSSYAANKKLSAARSFVSRVFQLPSHLLHPKHHHDEERSVENTGELFPIVGFCYVKGCNGRALPTVSNPSCRLHPTNEPVYGWYSQTCRLSCTDTDDEVMYSQPKEVLVEEEG